MNPQSQAFSPHISNNQHPNPVQQIAARTATFLPTNYPNASYPDYSNGHNASLHLQAGLKLQADVAQIQQGRKDDSKRMELLEEREHFSTTITAESQEILAEHKARLDEQSERIARVEKRLDEDARAKSVWGPNSPFPGVLSSTPQQVPQQDPTIDGTANMMSSLHLDAEEEPRSRALGANSRANSVRFDETANQNHFTHTSRPSLDMASRQSSGLSGGLHMGERTTSHRSEGRASSVHSMRSLASGRASSLNLDLAVSDPPQPGPTTAPGAQILGPLPAIIRLWMNTNFTHDSLLFAAICTGSYRSLLDLRLIQKLGFECAIRTPEEGKGPRTIALPIYFPEAVPLTIGIYGGISQHVPALIVEFIVVERASSDNEMKAIQIFIGSDVLVAHNADIMFSTGHLMLFDQQRHKLRIPLTRPVDAAAFNGLFVTSGEAQGVSQFNLAKEEPPRVEDRKFYLNGLGPDSGAASVSSPSPPPGAGKYRPPGVLAAASGKSEHAKLGGAGSDNEARPGSLQSASSRPALIVNTRQDEPSAEPGPQAVPHRPGQLMGSWRRDGPQPGTAATPTPLTWGAPNKSNEVPYQAKTSGMKTFVKPKLASRTPTATPANGGTSSPASEGRSKYFENGRRRSDDDMSKPATKENQPPTSVPKAKPNPIGTASAFPWLGNK